MSEKEVQDRPGRSGWVFPLAVMTTLLLLGAVAVLVHGVGQGQATSPDAFGDPKPSAIPSPTAKDSSQAVLPGVDNEPVVSTIPSPTAKASPPAVPDTPTPVDPLAPDFMLPDLDGTVWSLSHFRGRPVVLFFWATW